MRGHLLHAAGRRAGRLALALLLVAGVSAGARGDEPLPPEARVGAAATRVEFALETGSCWGRSTERRTVLVGKDGVEVRRTAGGAGVRRSLAWWEQTRALLNQGLAASVRRPKSGDCYVSNWICGFDVAVHAGGTPRPITGCCNRSREAAKVEQAFRRLKPGGPLGPDRDPVP
jgi:hypothetical protein